MGAIPHPYTGQIVVFKPEIFQTDRFYREFGYFDYKYRVRRVWEASNSQLILHLYVHEKIEGREGTESLDISKHTQRQVNIAFNDMILLNQSNQSYVSLLEKEY